MAKASTKKVGGAAPKTETETTPKPSGGGGPGLTKVDFDPQTAVDADGNPCVVTDKESDEYGLLTAVPANYDMNKHKALARADFKSEDVHLEFKATIADAWAKRYIDSATRYREQAANFRKFGDPATRKKALKLQKMREEYLRLREQMESEGHDLGDLGLDTPAKAD